MEFFIGISKTDSSKYYDKIFDLESRKNVEVRLEDKSVNWKVHGQYLTQQQLIVSSIVSEYFLTINSKEDGEAIQRYLHGLSMLAKTDIHLRIENLSFIHFYDAFKTSVLANQKDTTEENFAAIVFGQIKKMLINKEDFDRIMMIGKALQKNAPVNSAFSIEEVFNIKSFCEKYFLTLACRKQHKDKDLCLTLE